MAKRLSVGVDPQPHVFASLTPMSSARRVPASSAAPPQSIFAGLLIGDSGIQRKVATIATAMKTKPSQKIHS